MFCRLFNQPTIDVVAKSTKRRLPRNYPLIDVIAMFCIIIRAINNNNIIRPPPSNRD